jgi:hypothetical protein
LGRGIGRSLLGINQPASTTTASTASKISVVWGRLKIRQNATVSRCSRAISWVDWAVVGFISVTVMAFQKSVVIIF